MSVYNVDIAFGNIAMVTKGVLIGCGKEIPIGPLMGYIDIDGKVVKFSEALNHFIVTPEYNGEARGLLGVPDSELKDKARQCAERKLQEKITLLKKAVGADVWCLYRQSMTCLKCDNNSSQPKGYVAWLECGIFATSFCLRITDEKPITGATG